MLCDVAAERAILASCFQYGEEAYYDVADILHPDSFTVAEAKVIWNCIKHIYENKENVSVDEATILSASIELGYDKFFTGESGLKYLRGVINCRTTLENARHLAAKIRRLQIANILSEYCGMAIEELQKLSGDETLDKILSIPESKIFELNDTIAGKSSDMSLMADGLLEHLEYIENNPVDMVGISTGYPRYDEAIGGGLRRKEIEIIGARMKQGKALRNGSIVYTVNGPKNIEELSVGEKVCHPNGGTSLVLGIYPQGIKKIYRLTFNDNSYVDCCEEHLWNIKFYKHNEYKTIELKSIINKELRTKGNSNQHKYSIPQSDFTYFNKKEVLIDPYIMGVLLGDGSFRNNGVNITSCDTSIITKCKTKIKNEIRKIKSHKYDYRIIGSYKNIIPYLKKLGLWNKLSKEKHIPKEYLYNSYDVRLELLRGLMDTDGYSSKKGDCIYYTSSLELAKDVKSLAESLGFIAKLSNKMVLYKKINTLSYSLRISTNDNRILFNLKRKRDRCNKRKKNNICRKIESIEYIGEDNCTCIRVSADDGLFLTNNHIVTHNSQLVDNIAIFIATKLKIPVMNLDTEMSKEQHWYRILSNMTGIKKKYIETGQYSLDPELKARVREAAKTLKESPYYYNCTSGKNFEDVLSSTRRWLNKEVGYDKDSGKLNDCVLIYDYLKLIDDSPLKSMQEYQALGFMMMTLKNFLIRYDVPCLAFMQLNRDGIDEESTAVASGSDRILMYCTSFTIFKQKSDEEIAEDGIKNGNKKLIPIICRNGSGLDFGDYINMQFDGDFSRIVELKTKKEILLENKDKLNSGFDNQIDDDQDIPFADE